MIDGNTGLPWKSINSGGINFGSYGNVHCTSHYFEQTSFIFNTSSTLHPQLSIPWHDVAANFIDSIPNGHYILIYSHNDPDYTSWHSNLTNKVASLGAIGLLSLTSGTVDGPYIFFTRKGDPGFSPTETIGPGFSSVISENIIINGTWNQGDIKTPLIGPARAWGSVHWDHHASELSSNDDETIQIIGVRANGSEDVIHTTSVLDTSIMHINAVTYPYLRLRLNTRDDTTRTPTQLDFWRVLFEPVPEAALSPSVYLDFVDDTLQQGQDMSIKIGVESLTDIAMDSMLVKYTIQDANNNLSNSYNRYDSLQGLDTMSVWFNQNTIGNNYVGTNYVVVEINPDDDQLEQYHFNNVGILPFHVLSDKINPLLDITFDGVHILDGDIVSAEPLIQVSLKDENPYLALDDTSLLEVSIKHPDGTIELLPYDNVRMTFYPANPSSLGSDNTARIELMPNFTVDGDYELIIQDKDKSGNSSSRIDSRIGFKVVLKPGITHVLNYPNPFTTSTRFVFTITGVEVPTYFKIQIMTVKGTVVKEIEKDELGPLHIGRNLTEYAWDGTDEYGDALGNGVYFYRVVSSLNGEKMDHIDTGADKFFKKGFGKMVLIR